MSHLRNDLFLIQFAATLLMTGLIWFVQIVHYPLFAYVGEQQFVRYATLHANRTSWVVFPPMFLELTCSLAALSPALRPAFMSQPTAILSAVLVVALWASTGLVQVPLHTELSQSPTPAVIRRLVLSNWLRTGLWTARSVVMIMTVRHAL